MDYPRPEKVILVVQSNLEITTASLCNHVDDWGLSPRLRPVDSPSNQIRKYEVIVGGVWCASDGETVLRDDTLPLGTVRLTALPGDRTEAVIRQGYWEQAHERGYIDNDETLEWYQQFFDRFVNTLVADYGATGERVIEPGTAFEERGEIGKPPTRDGAGNKEIATLTKPERPTKPKGEAGWDEWFAYYDAMQAAGFKYTLADVAGDTKYSSGYVRQKKAEYDAEHKT